MATCTPDALADFLSGPGPKVKVERVDFAKTDLPELSKLYAIILDDVLTAAECTQLIEAAEATSGGVWEPAMVNTGNYRQELRVDQRDCGRIIWDDRQIQHVPEIECLKAVPLITGNGPTKRQETWQFSRLNERMRFLKYGAGQYFRPHCDGTYQTPDKKEMSFYTLHLYLNESDPNGPYGKLLGGSTTFHSNNMAREVNVKPKLGRVLIFQHRGLLHSGEEVDAGIKMTLRTDLMYKKV
ncbi:hypothetical protein MMC14_004180 [Varicellaria rhodocarpa]|nr:hypothetical protein [Varicellaria rhodocarpa]